MMVRFRVGWYCRGRELSTLNQGASILNYYHKYYYPFFKDKILVSYHNLINPATTGASESSSKRQTYYY